MNSTCWISLGANLGDRPAALQSAIAQLDAASGISVARVSAFYETPPWGKTDQPPFLNAAAELTTTFASRYTREVSLAGALSPEAIAVYGKRATGEKYLILPHR